MCTRPRARSPRRPRAMAPQQGGVDPAMANFLEEEKRKAMFNEVRRIPIASISTRLDGFPNPDDAIADLPH